MLFRIFLLLILSLPSLGLSASIKTDSWMHDLQVFIAHRPLCHLAIPGTHDSATHLIHSRSRIIPAEISAKITSGRMASTVKFLTKLARPMIAKWARATKIPVDQQLEQGARYLDLRVVKDTQFNDPSPFFTFHFLVSENLKDVLDRVKRFIDGPGREKEIVILDFNTFAEMDSYSHQELADLIDRTFGPKLAPESMGPSATLQEFWQNKYQVIVLYDEKEKFPELKDRDNLWSRNWIRSDWPNAQDFTKLYKENEKEIRKRQVPEFKNKFFVIRATLTPVASTIAQGFLPRRPHSLEDWTEPLDKNGLPIQKKSVARNAFSKIQKRPQFIFMGDFIENWPDLVQQILASNR